MWVVEKARAHFAENFPCASSSPGNDQHRYIDDFVCKWGLRRFVLYLSNMV